MTAELIDRICDVWLRGSIDGLRVAEELIDQLRNV